MKDSIQYRQRGGVQLILLLLLLFQELDTIRQAVAFVNDMLDKSMPELAKTTKANLNRTIRRSIDEAIELGLTGDLMYDYITGQVEIVLPKKLIGRAY